MRLLHQRKEAERFKNTVQVKQIMDTPLTLVGSISGRRKLELLEQSLSTPQNSFDLSNKADEVPPFGISVSSDKKYQALQDLKPVPTVWWVDRQIDSGLGDRFLFVAAMATLASMFNATVFLEWVEKGHKDIRNYDWEEVSELFSFPENVCMLPTTQFNAAFKGSHFTLEPPFPNLGSCSPSILSALNITSTTDLSKKILPLQLEFDSYWLPDIDCFYDCIPTLFPWLIRLPGDMSPIVAAMRLNTSKYLEQYRTVVGKSMQVRRLETTFHRVARGSRYEEIKLLKKSKRPFRNEHKETNKNDLLRWEALPQKYFILHFRQGDKIMQEGGTISLDDEDNSPYCTFSVLREAYMLRIPIIVVTDDEPTWYSTMYQWFRQLRNLTYSESPLFPSMTIEDSWTVNHQRMPKYPLISIASDFYNTLGFTRPLSKLEKELADLELLFHARAIIQHSPLGWSSYSAFASLTKGIPLFSTWKETHDQCVFNPQRPGSGAVDSLFRAAFFYFMRVFPVLQPGHCPNRWPKDWSCINRQIEFEMLGAKPATFSMCHKDNVKRDVKDFLVQSLR